MNESPPSYGTCSKCGENVLKNGNTYACRTGHILSREDIKPEMPEWMKTMFGGQTP